MNTIGTYAITQTLGQGSYGWVAKAENCLDNSKVAIKYFGTDYCAESTIEEFKKEVSIMKLLNHQNLIKIIDGDENSEYIQSSKRKNKVCFIAMELGREENLYKIMVQTGRFSESLARYGFKQIIDAVEYMHYSGVAHCDIKLENIIFDDEFNIKIGDFGFSTEERTRSNKKGTSNYLAPEVFINSEYETFPADIFAIGIVLFEMIKGIYPFGSATIGDKYFSLLQSKNSYFWKVHSKRETKGFFSEELKYLINGMLNVDIDQRFTFEDIKKSDWYNGDGATSDEVKLELSQRGEIIASNCTQ